LTAGTSILALTAGGEWGLPRTDREPDDLRMQFAQGLMIVRAIMGMARLLGRVNFHTEDIPFEQGELEEDQSDRGTRIIVDLFSPYGTCTVAYEDETESGDPMGEEGMMRFSVAVDSPAGSSSFYLRGQAVGTAARFVDEGTIHMAAGEDPELLGPICREVTRPIPVVPGSTFHFFPCVTMNGVASVNLGVAVAAWLRNRCVYVSAGHGGDMTDEDNYVKVFDANGFKHRPARGVHPGERLASEFYLSLMETMAASAAGR